MRRTLKRLELGCATRDAWMLCRPLMRSPDCGYSSTASSRYMSCSASKSFASDAAQCPSNAARISERSIPILSCVIGALQYSKHPDALPALTAGDAAIQKALTAWLSPRRVDAEHCEAAIWVAPNCAHTPAAILDEFHEAAYGVFSTA